MGTINAKEFIDELIFCIKEEDIVKARALLQFASDDNVSEEIQKAALGELSRGPDRVVLPLVEFLTKIEIASKEIRDGLYDLILDKAYGSTDLLIQYMTKNEKTTRILFIRAAGDLFLNDTADTLTRIITEESDPQILETAVQALGNLRREDSLGVFAPLSGHPDLKVRKAAIFAISENSSQEAADQLLEFLGEDEQTNKLVVEALAEMQDLYALDKLTSLLASPVTLVRDTAIDQIMKLGTKATPLLTRAFKNAEADYLVHLITTLGYLKDPAAVSAIMDIVNTQPKDANIRQAAYEAMERIPSPKTAVCLAQGLQDPVEAVRMSAARAIDKNLSKPLVAGLKNIIRDGSEGARSTVAALIDTEAANIFNFLADEPAFTELAGEHLATSATPATQKAFLKQMASLGKKELVSQLQKKAGSPADSHPAALKLIVVDDSKMMLKLYQNKLSALGYEARVFNRPEDAVPKILAERPDLVITDLNMPNINGLELTREVRKKYTRQEVPILMITTQSDFVEEKTGDIDVNSEILKKSGINLILHKPFTDEAFKEAVTRFLNG